MPVPFAVKAMALGWFHSCALSMAGEVACWGENTYGELGDGTKTDSHLPVRLALADVTEIAVGWDHSCAVTRAHELFCWGKADRLGAGATGDQKRPIKVPVADVEHVAATATATCASTLSGDVQCWGENTSGQLGRGNQDAGLTPGLIRNRVGPIKALRGTHATMCALTTSSELYCWGNAEPMGANASNYEPAPTRVPVASIADASVGTGHLCFLSAAGALTCQGANSAGQVGNDGPATVRAPAFPTGYSAATPVSWVATGGNHTCAKLASGKTQCWGEGASGQLATGTTERHREPVNATMLGDMSAAAAGIKHACAWNAAGEAYCWGANSKGQVGDGSTTDALAPRRVRF